MAEVSVTRVSGALGNELVAANESLSVRWESGAQLVLSDPTDERTRVVGGLLVELAPATGERRPRSLGLGVASTTRIPDPVRFTSAYGDGVAVERHYPVAVQPLAVSWKVAFYDHLPVCVIHVSLRNVSSDNISIRRLFPFVAGAWWGSGCLQLGERTTSFDGYKNGWQSWSYSGGLPAGAPDPRPKVPTLVAWHSPGGRSPRAPISGHADLVCDGMGMLGHATGRTALLAGFVSQERWFGQIYLERGDGALAACALLDDHTVEPGDEVTAPPLLLAMGTERDVLDHYARAVASEGNARRSFAAPTGWCSWYQYFTKVSEAAVVENLTTLRSQRSTLPVDVVQIDDGYQTAVGDWLSIKETFPHGMAAVAERIREAGYRPGIWLAPFTVAANSRLAREHPEWLVQDARRKPVVSGKNWDTALHCLDVTHPGARNWLDEVFAVIVRDWGFDYLKLDFLVSGAAPGVRYDPFVTRAGALRAGLQLIREIVGDEVFLVGCGCPLLSAVGIVDAMRIGPDSAPHWSARYKGLPVPLGDGHSLPALSGAIRNTLTRAWMRPAMWINDPDCQLVRDNETELTADEVRMFASAVGLTGGMVMISDRVSRLTVERLEIAARLLPPMRERALPMTHFAAGIPECVAVEIVRDWGRWWLVGLFNSDTSEREMRADWGALGLAAGDYHAVESWTGEYLGLSSDGVAVRVPAHGAAVLALHPDTSAPQLLGTNLHITQGAVEIEDWIWNPELRTLAWETRIGRHAVGAFTIWLPQPLRVKRLSSTSSTASWRRGARSEYIVTADIRDEARFTLEVEGDLA